MMREHYRRGDLDGVTRAVESSSGNTVFSIALAARQFGVEKTLSFVPHEISWHKLLMLLFFGVEPIVNQEPPHPDASDPRSGVYKARKRGKRKGWINPGQYDNPDNPKSHQKWTAKQIWEQTGGRIGVFCAGLGTTGTLDGLRERNGEIQCVFICPDSPIPYLDEYFKYLQASDFPTIQNEELLVNRPRQD
jgi:cystathionine beta-synthase